VIRALLTRWRRDASGAAAVELALVLPFAIMLVIGCISGSQMISIITGLHFAVEEGARCYAVNKTSCSSATAAQAYAASKFSGGGGAVPVFTASTAACGRRVTATVKFEWGIGMENLSVPLSATSCFPAIAAAT
jgi:Flp pilus assembly protein TadG